MANEILVSVVMPVYNGANYIKNAIESVKEQQVSWELYVIDDCSTDQTPLVLEEYQKDERIHIKRTSEWRSQGMSAYGKRRESTLRFWMPMTGGLRTS